jgi:hypothetical protein
VIKTAVSHAWHWEFVHVHCGASIALTFKCSGTGNFNNKSAVPARPSAYGGGDCFPDTAEFRALKFFKMLQKPMFDVEYALRCPEIESALFESVEI